ncbi:MAG: class D sortase [Acidobacteria bacterium]|nr:class D sortase [Acidobacteriota bacterium]
MRLSRAQLDMLRHRGRAALPYILICSGVALLVYVSSEYALMLQGQRALQHQFAVQASARMVTAPDSLVRIAVPKINLDAIVVEGTSRKDLMKGPGHIRSSAYPGESGNVVISAHRDTFFRHIYELSKGDQIQLQRGGATYTYEVTGKKITDPNDLSVLQQTEEPRLTLITCYPTYYVGPAPERLVIFARLLTASNQAEARLSTTAQASGKPE